MTLHKVYIAVSSKIYIKKLILENFRSHKDFTIEPRSNNIIITGANGSGKTSILEAISLLSPGRGLRNADPDDLNKIDSGKPFGLLAKVGIETTDNTTQEIRDIKIINTEDGKRKISIDDKFISGQKHLTKTLNIVWLMPQMEYVFTSSPSNRRKFLDRIVFNFTEEHLSLINSYDGNIKERLKLLEHGRIDQKWLSQIENNIAKLAINIAKNRIKIVEYLNYSISNATSNFPKAILSIDGEVEKSINNEDDLLLLYTRKLENNREKDKITHKTHYGIHRSDLSVVYAENNKPMYLCSSGEQKSLFIAITLAFIREISLYHKRNPIVLLDEVTSFLDSDKLKNFFLELSKLDSQIWMTCISPEKFIDFIKTRDYVQL